MNGRAAGVGFPILVGGYLLYKYLPQSQLFSEGANANATLPTALSALGAFLLILALVFLFRNLK